ncbi:MAG: SCO family protein [Pseudomonadota bacterium]
MTKIYAWAAGGLVAAMLGAFAVMVAFDSRGMEFAHCAGGAVGGDIGGPFTLVSETGETVTSADVLTEPSLIYFGYTFCPDVCPMDMARNADAVALLETRGHMVAPIFISVDPKRDTPEVLADFTDNLHDRMIGLTGNEEQVRRAAQAYKAFYDLHDEGDDEFYLVDHSTMTYLILPGHGFVDFFRRDTTPEEMADRVACFVDTSF